MLTGYSRALILLVVFASFPPTAGAETSPSTCTPLRSPIVYIVAKDEHLADISRTVGMLRIWTKTVGSVPVLARTNRLPNRDRIYPGQKIELAFRCEEAAAGLQLLDVGSYRSVDPTALTRTHTWRRADGTIHNSLHPAVVRHETTVGERRPATEAPATEAAVSSAAASAAAAMPLAPPAPLYQLDFAPHVSFLRIDARQNSNGSSAVLLSSVDYGLRAQVARALTDSLKAVAGVALEQITIAGANSKAISGPDQLYSALSAGVRYRPPSSRTEWQLLAGASQELFYRASSTSHIVIEPVTVPRLDFAVRHDLVQNEKWTFGLQAELAGLGRASANSYDVSLGYGYRGEAYFQRHRPNERLMTTSSIYMGRSTQDTSLLTSVRTDVGIGIALTWAVGK